MPRALSAEARVFQAAPRETTHVTVKVSQSFSKSQHGHSVLSLSRSHPALTPPPALNPAPPLPFNHKYRVLAPGVPGGYSIVASEVSLSQRTGGSLSMIKSRRNSNIQ